jgi:acetyl-CoA decarbonylase/synthase complex subunit gamma
MAACRISNRFRMRYRVVPGLYAAGEPGPADPVFVSANYRYSFDVLRSGLNGSAAWILVLETAGINVWCAAGKGSFGTAELSNRIGLTGLADRVSHRELILPQLGASGVQAHRVREATGFLVRYGPVRARDIAAYLKNGRRATAEMRRVGFPLPDRIVLIPIEFFSALRTALPYLAAVFVFLGLFAEGILFAPAWQAFVPVLFAFGLALVLGTAGFAILLPLLPFCKFFVRALPLGAAGFLLWYALPGSGNGDPFLVGTVAVGLPLYVSYLACLFTGCTTFTGPSGVKQELQLAWPVFRIGRWLGCAGLVLYKLHLMGVI